MNSNEFNSKNFFSTYQILLCFIFINICKFHKYLYTMILLFYILFLFLLIYICIYIYSKNNNINKIIIAIFHEKLSSQNK